MGTVIAIALGGGLGAVSRYGISQIPILHGGGFPWATFAANLLGAFIIGLIAGAVVNHASRLSSSQMGFLKTGFCGGLTTFSTFSLEAFQLLDDGRYLLAMGYVVASVVLCVLGVWIGRGIAMRVGG